MREKIEIAKYDSKVAASIRRRVDLNGLLAAADKVKALDRALLLSYIVPDAEAIEFSAIMNTDLPKFRLQRAQSLWAYNRKPPGLSPHFVEALSIIGTKFLLKAETGRRCLIDQYILEALRNVQGNVGVCPEYAIAATGVGEIIVHGVIDYVFGRGVAGSYRDHLDGLSGKLQAPISTMIMEAKAEDTFDNGFGQAVAQCAALRNSQGLATAFGVLTNGLWWKFFLVTKDGVLQDTDIFRHEAGHTEAIVDILSAWIQGVIPDDLFKVLPEVNFFPRSHTVHAQIASESLIKE